MAKEEVKTTLSDKLERTKDQELFEPTETEATVTEDVFHRFRRTQDLRNRNLEYFDGINLTTYINDSVRRFTTNIDERENIEDWQARINVPFTREKVLAILGKIVARLPIARFKGRGDEDIRKGIILTNLYEYSEALSDYDEMMTHFLLEAIVKGTAIAYEGVEEYERKLREVKGIGDKTTVTEVTEKEIRLIGTLVPLEQFYPSSIGLRSISKLPYCFWRKVLPYSVFVQEWATFDRHKFVLPKQRFQEDEDRPFYLDWISDDVAEGNVEIIRYYNKDDDQYVIIANGIWLNPLEGKDGKQMIAPLPFTHKELPFWDVKFDFYGDFFYGKSLPDRLKSMQDVLNVLTNMLLDQSFLTIFPPLLTSGFDSIEDDYLRPGRRTPIDTQGLPLNQAFMTLDLGTPGNWHQFILEYTKNIMEQASVDQIQSGQAGVGERTTAQEIRTASEGVAAMLGLFQRMINTGIRRKALLRGANILQFWTTKDSPVLQRVGGDTGREDFNKAFNVFKIDNTALTDGRRGVKIIELFGEEKDVPTQAQNKARAVISESESGQAVEIATLPGSYIRNFVFDVEVIPDIRRQETKQEEKALQLEKVRIYMTFFPQQINLPELAAQTAETMGDDPTRILNAGVFQGEVPQQGNELDQGLSTTPTQNTANNITRSLRGGEPRV